MNFRVLMQTMAIALRLVPVAMSVPVAPVTYQLRVDGLTCPFCADCIENTLGMLEGVDRVAATVEEGSVIVTMRVGASLNELTAKKAVNEAGFSLRWLEPVRPAP